MSDICVRDPWGAVEAVVKELGAAQSKYGPEHDDALGEETWLELVHEYSTTTFNEGETFETRMIRVAALSIAAIESCVRKEKEEVDQFFYRNSNLRERIPEFNELYERYLNGHVTIPVSEFKKLIVGAFGKDGFEAPDLYTFLNPKSPAEKLLNAPAGELAKAYQMLFVIRHYFNFVNDLMEVVHKVAEGKVHPILAVGDIKRRFPQHFAQAEKEMSNGF